MFNALTESTKKMFDDIFQEHLDSLGECEALVDTNMRFAKERLEKLKSNPPTQVTPEDIKQISALVVLATQTQKISLLNLKKLIFSIKTSFYYSWRLPTSLIRTLIPEMAIATRELISERAQALEQMINEKREVELRVPENVAEVLKEIAEYRERVKKAQSEYVK
jgi:hypothetical protein